MKTFGVICFVGLLLPGPGSNQSDAIQAELKKFQGSWKIEKEILDGKEIPAEELKKITLHFSGDGQWHVEMEGKGIVAKGTMVLDVTKKPKTVDYHVTDGDEKGKKFPAIYELVGDSFKHCGSMKETRPTEFGSKPGSEFFYTTFRRVKKSN